MFTEFAAFPRKHNTISNCKDVKRFIFALLKYITRKKIDMSKLKNWKEEAPANCYACCTAALKEENEPAELFGRSWHAGLSPLIWRIPIFLWAIVIISWSTAHFWGPREKFLLYMTHWGLILIFLESLFGIVVAIKNIRGHPSGKLLDTITYLPDNN